MGVVVRWCLAFLVLWIGITVFAGLSNDYKMAQQWHSIEKEVLFLLMALGFLIGSLLSFRARRSPSAQGWICTECGAIVEGDTCMKCGNTRPIEAVDHTVSDAYRTYYGVPRDPLAARALLIVWLSMAILMAVGVIYIILRPGP